MKYKKKKLFLFNYLFRIKWVFITTSLLSEIHASISLDGTLLSCGRYVFTFGRLLYISVLNWTKSKQFMVTLPHILWDKLVCSVCFLKTKLLIAVSTFNSNTIKYSYVQWSKHRCNSKQHKKKLKQEHRGPHRST